LLTCEEQQHGWMAGTSWGDLSTRAGGENGCKTTTPKWQAYGQAGTVGSTCKDPKKDRVAAAGATRKAKAASKFTAIKKLRMEDQYVENSYIAIYSTMRSSWLPLRTEYWSSAPRRGVIPFAEVGKTNPPSPYTEGNERGDFKENYVHLPDPQSLFGSSCSGQSL
jgi:hypothetical protein